MLLSDGCLDAGTTCDQTVAIGAYALDHEYCDQNTAVGYNAGGAVTTGNNNTCLGHGAGRNITTGYNNIFIGEGVDIGSATGNHRFVIGNNINDAGDNTFAFGKASNRVYNVFTSNASWTRDSDVRLKKDIQTNTDLGLGFINDLRTVTYKWKAPSEIDSSLSSYDADKTKRYSSKMWFHW